MPLIKEMKMVLPFISEMPEDWQQGVASFISSMVINFDNERTMTRAQRERLSALEGEEIMRRRSVNPEYSSQRTRASARIGIGTSTEISMPLLNDIEKQLPLVAELPDEWQKDIAIILSRHLVAYDDRLTKSSRELRELRDREIEDFNRHFGLKPD